MELYRVEQIAEGDYGCEELPEDAPVLCSVTLQGPTAPPWWWKCPTRRLTAQSIQEGCTVLGRAALCSWFGPSAPAP